MAGGKGGRGEKNLALFPGPQPSFLSLAVAKPSDKRLDGDLGESLMRTCSQTRTTVH